MHPFEKIPPGLPPGVSPHLDVCLKPGWRLDRRRRALVSDAGQSVSLRGLLPAGAKIVPLAPTLAAATRALSADEDFLARHLQVVLPPAADPSRLAADLRALDGVEVISNPPPLALP